MLTRRGHTLSVATNGRRNRAEGKLYALADTVDVGSSGLAREVEAEWHRRRAWYPDEHPIRALHLARELCEAARRCATRRARGRRMLRW